MLKIINYVINVGTGFEQLQFCTKHEVYLPLNYFITVPRLHRIFIPFYFLVHFLLLVFRLPKEWPLAEWPFVTTYVSILLKRIKIEFPSLFYNTVRRCGSCTQPISTWLTCGMFIKITLVSQNSKRESSATIRF